MGINGGYFPVICRVCLNYLFFYMACRFIGSFTFKYPSTLTGLISKQLTSEIGDEITTCFNLKPLSTSCRGC